MKATQAELTKWAISQIELNYKDDVALLIAVPGHAMENDCHGECFDYFVPATEKGYDLSKTFILDGVGHDLYPRSWERIENMADFRDEHSYALGEGIILYYRSEADRDQFIQMQQRQKANFQNKAFMYGRALEQLDSAMDIYRTMMFEDSLHKVKMGAGFIAHYLSLAVAYMNGKYFIKRLELETLELSEMSHVPDHFVSYYEAIVKATKIEELKSLSYVIIGTARTFLNNSKPPVPSEPISRNYQGLTGWYEELSLTWRRLYIQCDHNNYKRAFPYALYLQHELNIMKAEFNLEEMNLMGYFDTNNLLNLKEKALELEKYIIQVITEHGCTINQYDTLEQFLDQNS